MEVVNILALNTMHEVVTSNETTEEAHQLYIERTAT